MNRIYRINSFGKGFGRNVQVFTGERTLPKITCDYLK